MRNRIFQVFISLLIFTSFCFLLVTGGYFYIKKNNASVDKKVENIPYEPIEPDNCGIMFDITGKKTFAYFDFNDKTIMLIFEPQIDDNTVYGYSLDRYVNTDNGFFEILTDLTGGITTEDNTRYAGVQIKEMLDRTANNEKYYEIVGWVISNIAKKGLSKQDFVEILNYCDTDMTVPDCYYWNKYIKTMCNNIYRVNNPFSEGIY